MEAILLLISVVIVLLVLIVAANGKRKSFSVPGGKKIYGDMLTKGKVLRSERYLITGKPDMITRKGKVIVPYEYKSGNASEPRTGHLLQMGAYFIILGDMYPESIIKYGILKYGNSTFRVENTHGLRSRVLDIANEIRTNSGVPSRNHNDRGRCFRCPYKNVCSQNLINYRATEDA
jgi:CRISPR-associated exonuclease Cas4